MTKKAPAKKVTMVKVGAVKNPFPALAKLEQQVGEMQKWMEGIENANYPVSLSAQIDELCHLRKHDAGKVENLEQKHETECSNLYGQIKSLTIKVDALESRHEAGMAALTASLHALEVKLTATIQAFDKDHWQTLNSHSLALENQYERIGEIETKLNKRPWWKFWRRKA